LANFEGIILTIFALDSSKTIAAALRYGVAVAGPKLSVLSSDLHTSFDR
jgi:hypothetical protein